MAVRKDCAAVVEDDDAIAQQPPALLGMGNPDMGAASVRGDCGRTAGIVIAHEIYAPFGVSPESVGEHPARRRTGVDHGRRARRLGLADAELPHEVTAPWSVARVSVSSAQEPLLARWTLPPHVGEFQSIMAITFRALSPMRSSTLRLRFPHRIRRTT